MMDLNNDLSIASRLTKGLKSWLPRWRVPKSQESEHFFVLSKNDVPKVFSTDVVYFASVSKMEGLPCVATVAREGLSFMHNDMQILHFFKWADVSRLQVISLWEISVTQYLIGKPDVKCYIVCVNILSLLQEIETYLPHKKIEYVDDELESAWEDVKAQEKKEKHQSQSTKETSRQKPSQAVNRRAQDCKGEHAESQQMPTDSEITLISKELKGLKSLSLDIQKVEDDQLKEIDELTIAVTKGSDKLSGLNKTMKKM